MVRTLVGSESFLAYLTTVVNGDACTVGLILGQHTPAKDYVVHFAKTPPVPGTENGSVKKPKNIRDITESFVADHAKHATRLLPGGMHVLGLFIVTNEDPFSLENMDKVRSIVREMQEQLKTNKFLFANYETPEKVVLHYKANSRQCTCKSIDPVTGVLKPAEFKFTSTKIPWVSVECFYELSQKFPIPEKETESSLKKHMFKILTSIMNNFNNGVFLYDGVPKSSDETLEVGGKKSKHSNAEAEKRSVQVSIILPSDCSDLEKTEVKNCGGQISISGQIASKVWVPQNMAISEVSKIVSHDIVRSLAARLDMHWDILIEEEHGSPEDRNSIHEPPRRIFFKLPGSEVTLSDYLFPGEGPQESEISLKELLDITLNEKEAFLDMEGQADLTEFYNEKLGDTESEEILQKLPGDSHKFMYLLGGGIALLVLLISIIYNYMRG